MTDDRQPRLQDGAFCDCPGGAELRSYRGSMCKDCMKPSWEYTQGEKAAIERFKRLVQDLSEIPFASGWSLNGFDYSGTVIQTDRLLVELRDMEQR